MTKKLILIAITLTLSMNLHATTLPENLTDKDNTTVMSPVTKQSNDVTNSTALNPSDDNDANKTTSAEPKEDNTENGLNECKEEKDDASSEAKAEEVTELSVEDLRAMLVNVQQDLLQTQEKLTQLRARVEQPRSWFRTISGIVNTTVSTIYRGTLDFATAYLVISSYLGMPREVLTEQMNAGGYYFWGAAAVSFLMEIVRRVLP